MYRIVMVEGKRYTVTWETDFLGRAVYAGSSESVIDSDASVTRPDGSGDSGSPDQVNLDSHPPRTLKHSGL